MNGLIHRSLLSISVLFSMSAIVSAAAAQESVSPQQPIQALQSLPKLEVETDNVQPEKQQEASVELQPLKAPPVQETRLTNHQLLELFSTPEDAIYARDKKLSDLEKESQAIQAQLQQLQAIQKQKLEWAAALEFNGQAVPKLDSEDFLNRNHQIQQIQQIQTELSNKQNEKKLLQADYDQNIQRLQKLSLGKRETQ